MEDFLSSINHYVELNKKNSKLTKSEVVEVISRIEEKLKEKSVPMEDIIDVLLNLHYSVFGDFT